MDMKVAISKFLFRIDIQFKQNQCPTFYKLWIHHFAPTVLTLYIRSIRIMASNKIPPFAMNFNQSS